MAKNNLKISYLSEWKPCLAPNEPSGTTPDYEERLDNPLDWYLSTKRDGGRVELIANINLDILVVPGLIRENVPAYSRELKVIPSVHIQKMASEFNNVMCHIGIVEAEFFSPNMTFAEVMHFFRSEDVTSVKNVKKYKGLWKRTKGGTIEISKGVEYPTGTLEGEELKKAVRWMYPGRSVEWLTSWHDCLKFYVFDHYLGNGDIRGKKDRCEGIEKEISDMNPPHTVFIKQKEFDNVDAMYQAFDQEIMNGQEGLFLCRKDAVYKCGRYTINEAKCYKVVESNKEWEGVVIEIEQSTVVKKGVEKTVNAFGRSKTSKLQEDREDSGMAKGLKVRMDDGNILTVSFNGYTHENRVELFNNPELLMGKRITFTGKLPVSNRADSVPRQCHYHKEN